MKQKICLNPFAEKHPETLGDAAQRHRGIRERPARQAGGADGAAGIK